MQDAELSQGGALGIAEFQRTGQLDRHSVRLAEHRPGRWRRLRIGRDVHREQAAGEAALAGAGQVDVPLVAAVEKAATCAGQPGCAERAELRAPRLEQTREYVVVPVKDGQLG